MKMNARRLYSDLLRDWCDGMQTLQIPENGHSTLYRSIQDLSARLIREAQGLSFLAEGVLADEQQRGGIRPAGPGMNSQRIRW